MLGGSWLRIMPRSGSILQAETSQISWDSKMEPSVAKSSALKCLDYILVEFDQTVSHKNRCSFILHSQSW